MPDQRSVMKEFRFLDEKRLAQGLTPEEESRYAQLRDLMGPELGAGAIRPGFDVNAAAARLRDSLLPAGLRNRPPAPTPEPEPATTPEEAPDLSAADAIAAAFAEVPLAPLEPPPESEPYFDPAALGDTAREAPGDESARGYDPNAQAAWDPNAPYDPDTQAAWDPNAPYDPNAQVAWDPNAPYDPNAQATWDPNAPADPNAQAARDPNAPADPNAQATWDPNASYDPGAQPAAWDANAPPDPDAQATWDPNAPYDPDVQPAAWDANAPPDPDAQATWDPNAPFDPGAQPAAWDANAPSDLDAQATWDPNAPGDAIAPPDPAAMPYSELGASSPGLDEAFGSPDAGPPADAAAEPRADSGEGPLAGADLFAEPDAPFEQREEDTGGPAPAGWYAEPSAAEAGLGPSIGEYDEVAGALPGEDGGLESMLPFDPGAAAAVGPGQVPEGFEGGSGEYDDSAGFGGQYAELSPPDLEQDTAGFQAARTVATEATEGWQPDAALEDGFQLASGGSFDASHAAAAPEWAGGVPPPPWDREPEESAPVADAPLELAGEPPAGGEEEVAEAFAEAAYDAPGAGDDAPALEVSPTEASTGAFADGEPALPELSLEEPAADDAGASPEPEPASASEEAGLDLEGWGSLEPSFPDVASNDAGLGEALGEPAADELRVPPEEALPEEALPADALPPPEAPPADAPAAPGASTWDPAAFDAEDIPTIEGEEILEEILEEIPAEEVVAPEALTTESAAPEPGAAGAPSEPQPDPACHVPGAHRVVVHTVEGQVKRGSLEDARLDAGTLALSPQPAGPPEVVPTEKVKAIFFMLAPGETPPTPAGKKVRVTFRDGRQVAGFSPDYSEEGIGFYMIPADTRTNTGRIWVYRSAVRQVAVS